MPEGTCYVIYNSDSCMDGVFEAFQHHKSDSCWSEHRHYLYQMYFSHKVNRNVFELIKAQRQSRSSLDAFVLSAAAKRTSDREATKILIFRFI